jgi:putative redox protein
MSGNIVKVRKAADGKLKHMVEAGRHRFVVDEPEPVGDDSGPNPHDLLKAALASCTALTISLVARRKQWPLEEARVEITHEETDAVYHMRRKIELVGALDPAQREYLLGIANKCPIHRALHKRFDIETTLEPAPPAPAH